MSFRTPPRDYPGERGFVTSRRMLLGHGYAVLLPSLPLPRDHHDPIAGLADQIEAVIAAARADPALAGAFDPDRVALWGHSYGGYTAMAAIAQTHRYRAAVSIAGVSDFLGKWAAMLPPWRAAPEEAPHNNWSTGTVEANQEAMEAPPWVDPARYLRNSPLLLANRIETPLLLFHGDQDVVPLAQSEAMYAALYRQGKDAILVTDWGENHMMMNPGNVRDLFARAFAFLDEHLGPRVSLAPVVTPPSPGPAPASAAPTPPPPPPRGSRWRGTPGSG
jgi:dipeptidyl aminopeptidase/acylaminoacyl peptidase